MVVILEVAEQVRLEPPQGAYVPSKLDALVLLGSNHEANCEEEELPLLVQFVENLPNKSGLLVGVQ